MVGGESMWAEPLDSDIYRLENVPFFSYGLNFKDEVIALPDDDGILEITEVVKRSGNKTIRMSFDKSCGKEQQAIYFEKLRGMNCSLERWDDTFLSLNIKVDADFNIVYDQLDEWAEADILAFETCHERIEGSFDCEPEED